MLFIYQGLGDVERHPHFFTIILSHPCLLFTFFAKRFLNYYVNKFGNRATGNYR